MSRLHKYASKCFHLHYYLLVVNYKAWTGTIKYFAGIWLHNWSSLVCNCCICSRSSLIQLLNLGANISYITAANLRRISGSANETKQEAALTLWPVLFCSYPPSFSHSPPLSFFHSLLFPLWVCSLWKTGDMFMTKQKYIRWHQNPWWFKRNNVSFCWWYFKAQKCLRG